MSSPLMWSTWAVTSCFWSSNLIILLGLWGGEGQQEEITDPVGQVKGGHRRAYLYLPVESDMGLNARNRRQRKGREESAKR